MDKIVRVPSEASFYNKDNKKEYFDQYEGKTSLLVFWATWCSSCIQEMNQLDLLKKDLKKLPINIIALSEDYSGIDSIKEFY
mgnify:CR=1 FL=1